MKAFLVSLVTSPVGVITAAILGLGTAFYKVYQIIDDTTGGIRRSLKRVQEAQREFARESTMEQMAIDRLFGKLDALTKGTSEYQKVKDEILSKYGQYLKGLSAEIQALDDVKGAYEAISTAAKQAARIGQLIPQPRKQRRLTWRWKWKTWKNPGGITKDF